ncbi:MAG: hypothetical protein ACJAW8_002672 [Oleispira sp.]|jgi:hypothetical protein
MKEMMTMKEYITDHCHVGMDRAIAAERFPLWKRPCDTIDDLNFILHGLLRCIIPAKSDRHYLQITDEIYDETVCHSSYFNALKSARLMNRVKAQEKQSDQLHSETLSFLGIDYLKKSSELDEYRDEATDGHFIQHACHIKNSKGKVFAAGFIHALNFMNSLLRPLCVVTNGSEPHHEITALRSYIEQRHEKNIGKSVSMCTIKRRLILPSGTSKNRSGIL